MRVNRQKLLTVAALAAGMAVVALPAMATTIVPNCARVAGIETPGIECVLQTFRNVANLIVGITGSFALLMFVYGGFTMITSAGNEKKVSSGKQILVNAVIGIVLIFSSGYVVDYILNRLTAGGSTVISEGQVCNDGRGKYTSIEGVMTCVTSCAEMSDRGYSCMDSNVGEDCNAAFTCSGSGQTCCITPRP